MRPPWDAAIRPITAGLAFVQGIAEQPLPRGGLFPFRVR